MHSLGQNYREATAALRSVMDRLSQQQQQQQQHHLVSLLSPTTGLSRQSSGNGTNNTRYSDFN